MSIEMFALLLIVVGLILGLIGHFLPSKKFDPSETLPKDHKAINAQSQWEGLQPK